MPGPSTLTVHQGASPKAKAGEAPSAMTGIMAAARSNIRSIVGHLIFVGGAGPGKAVTHRQWRQHPSRLSQRIA
jgi:hypothetical protein